MSSKSKKTPEKISIVLLPPDFDEQIFKLEKQLKECTLSLEKVRDLLDMYKNAITYYTLRNEKRKNEFLSKYKFLLASQYVSNLMKKKIERYYFCRYFIRKPTKSKRKFSKEIGEQEAQEKALNIVEQIKFHLVEYEKILKNDIEKQEEEFQKRLLAKQAIFRTNSQSVFSTKNLLFVYIEFINNDRNK